MTGLEALKAAMQLADTVHPLSERFTKELQQLEQELGLKLAVKSFRKPTPDSSSKVIVMILFEPEQ